MSLASVIFSLSPLYFIIFLIVSLLVSLYFSRKYMLSGFKRVFLIALKTISLFLLLSLTANPSLTLTTSEISEPVNIMMTDNSRSITLKNKLSDISQIFSVNDFRGDNFTHFLFSDDLIQTHADSLINPKADGYKTSLSSALEELLRNKITDNIGSITVISDGNFDENPVYTAKLFQVPFITVMIGDTAKDKDIILKKIIYNEKANTGTKLLIRAEISSHMYSGSLKINLLRENSLLISNTEYVPPDQNNLTVDFSIVEYSPRKIRYRIEITPVDGELTLKNNYRDFFINFYEPNNNLLVISGGPGYDHQTITSVINRIGDYKTITRTLKTSDEFYEGSIDNEIYNKLALVVLINFPVNNVSSDLLSRIASEISSRSIPVAFFAGRNTDYTKLKIFGELIPFDIPQTGIETIVSVDLVGNGENPYINEQRLYSSLPNSFKNFVNIIPKPGAKTLMVSRSTGEPLVLTRTHGNTKSSSVLFYGLWKWKLNPVSDYGKLLDNFILQTVSLTADRHEKRKFRVWPAKDLFDYREKPVILAEVLNENYTPVTNAVVTGTLINSYGNTISEIKFEHSDGKNYKVTLPSLPYGNYRIQAVSEIRNVYYEKDSTRFMSDTLNNEFLVTPSNYLSLKELALNTGGVAITNYRFSDLYEIIDSISANKLTAPKSYTEKIILREKLWMLAIIILLFTAEWVFRKRNNLP